LENPLLLKDDVGKPKPSTYNLPTNEFIYGKALKRDKEGAKEGYLQRIIKYYFSVHDMEIS